MASFVSKKLVGPVVAAGAVLIGTSGFASIRPDYALRAATGSTAQTLCSQVFVSGLPASDVWAQTVAPSVGHPWLMKPLRFVVDRERREVRARWAGLFPARSVFREGRGCMLWMSKQPVPVAAGLSPAQSRPLLPPIAGPERVKTPNHDLGLALDRAFAEPADGPPRRLQALVIVQHGQVTAERYADGIGVDTPLMGRSLTKTTMSALIGTLVAQGRLSLAAPAAVPEWSKTLGPPITLEHLLRMTSGLQAEETGSGFDFNSRMLYGTSDTAAYAAGARAVRQPGLVWQYQSANTALVSRILKDAVGGTESAAQNYARTTLFAPLGMNSAILETDAAGTPVGSQGMLASARDWAKLGLLYLGDGVVGGKRLLPEGWVAASSRSTLGSPYGMGLWTNASTSSLPQAQITRAGLPSDAYYASGRLGQRIYIIPSEDLVIVRLGISQQPDQGLRADMVLIRDVIAAGHAPVPAPVSAN